MNWTNNCKAIKLLNLVYYCGEFPKRALGVYGNSRDYISRVCKRLETEGYLKKETAVGRTTFVLGNEKAPIELLFYRHRNYYEKIRGELKNADKKRRNRNMIRAEACAFLAQAGIRVIPDEKPSLITSFLYQNSRVFYTTRELKEALGIENTGTYATRGIGVIVNREAFHMVYYLGNASIRMSEYTEQTTANEFLQLLNAKENWTGREKKYIGYKDAIVLSYSYKKVFRSLIRPMKGDRFDRIVDFSLSAVYEDYRLLPYSREGTQIFSLYMDKNGDKWLKRVALDGLEILSRPIDFPCDAISDGEYYLSFWDGRLKRLEKFIERAKRDPSHSYNIICFDYQEEALLECISGNVTLQVYKTKNVVLHFLEEKGEKDG